MGTATKRIIKLITLEDLMQSEEEIEWRIVAFLPKGCISLVTGITGVKRSFFLQQMGLALATGEDFLCYSIPEECKVAMYEAELTKGELKSRASRMLKLYPMTEKMMFNTDYSLLLDRDDGVGALIYTMDKYDIDVCILDPLYMVHTGNINVEQDAMKVLRPLEHHCLETGRNIIIATHSTKVSDAPGSNRGATGGAVKGTSSQVQVAAYVWRLSDSFLSRDEGKLIFEKTRDMPLPKESPLRFRPDTNTFLPKTVSDEKRVEFLKRKQPKDRSEAIELLRKWFDLGQSSAYRVAGLCLN